MDWKRIKTLLIIALFFINALLAYTYLSEGREVPDASIDRSLVIDMLADKDVIIDPSILEVSHDLSNLALMIQTYDESVVGPVFDKHEQYENKALKRIVHDIDSRLLYETVETGILDNTYLSDEMMLEQAYKLMDELQLDREDVYLISTGRTGKKTIFEFGQVYGGIAIKDSYMIIKYNNESLVSFERVWYDVTENELNSGKYKSVESALYEFSSKLYNQNPNRVRELNVVSFSLVYQLRDLSDTGDTMTISGQPNIYYEITTSDNNTYLVEAFNR